MHQIFELTRTFGKESHWWRYLLRCRDCGQLYFYEFYERVDFDSGDDPQWSTWIPVKTEKEAEIIDKEPVGFTRNFRPCFCKDWPKGEEKKSYYIT